MTEPLEVLESVRRRDVRRDPRETKAGAARVERAPGAGGACTPDGGCC